jgi:probable rRNA maturation factor
MVIFETAVKGVSAAEIQRFARQAQKLAKISGEVGVLISGNTRLRELNRRFRRKDKPTDVLSFPRPAGGDIAISADIARENAAHYGHGTAEELKVLVLHGMLHLAGYDHESDNGRMARAEARLRSQLRLPASLIDRAHSPALATSAMAGSAGRKRSMPKSRTAMSHGARVRSTKPRRIRAHTGKKPSSLRSPR